MTYRLFDPPQATGLAALVQRQLREDFLGPVPTFRALSPAPDVMAASWALMRESLLAGDAGRVEREIVAAAISRANRCRFCLDAHLTMLHGLGEHDLAETLARDDPPLRPRHATLARWAAASRTPRASAWTGPYGPPLTGTLLAFHFINRMVSALLGPDLLPGGIQRYATVRSTGGRLVARTARAAPEPGRSLPLLPAPVSPPPAWSLSTPIGVAYEALRGAASLGGESLSEAGRETVAATVRWEDGRHPARPAEWAADLVRDLPAAERVGTRIALLAAFAPAAISRGDAGLWQLSRPGPADLVRLIAYGAFTATDHVARALAPAHR
ncbi:carboxymuconolactone decarboxylase family protein [Actinoplanes bogorensis]|uniref:Carboxymuconolactone decarboxylase family protein n=1 Tax=Paractinoplanes bogorensis TaxID=1610840 RepID=A0ABS5YPN4_9ACTN|nr:carboxymuconolactone decarboxylase family protein [Actinoplanes bogorensis]MBU2664684.1 carboxymuconolactone decarboxylase family protein [Actinoplanes bogorensis]